MTDQAPDHAHVIPLRPRAGRREAVPRAQPTPGAQPTHRAQPMPGAQPTPRPESASPRPLPPAPAPREPLWRDLVGDVLRRERLAQERTLKDVAEAARISMPYLSEVERGRKEASSEVLAAAAQALGLGLGDLLSRAQGELVRLTARRTGGNRAMSRSSHNGLCLAA
ncbi:helix-turn-helix domain-containing protein [Streptomyces sp. NPDC052013]|uniref:helix-turn-helix domain-containing protein n=1 Tax=Streptomyces sp. NPDC052013 TaxID=3365679 RepID=UPI0037D08065